jgi:lysophospholipase L1-like esterase
MLVGSVVLMMTMYEPGRDPSRVYYGTDTRVAALLLGSALAFVWAPWRLVGRTGRNAGLVLDGVAVASGIVLFWMFLNIGEFDPGLYRGGFLLVAIASTLLIAATVHPASRFVPWLLGFSVFRWIGVRSYGIYLWHWPIYMVTRPHSDLPLTGLPLLILRLALTFVAAALSYKYVEEPIRHGAVERWWAHFRAAPAALQRQLATRFALVGTGLAVGLVVIVIGLGNGGSAAAPAALGGRTAVILRPGDTTSTVPGATTTTPANPAPGAPTTVPGTPVATVSAIGDSVMLGAVQQLKATIDTMYAAPVTGIDAKESRQFSTGVDVIANYKNQGALGRIVVVQLGTNGTVDPGDFDRLMGILGDRQKVVIINAKVPRPWEQQVNDTFAAGVEKYSNAELLDWHDYGGAHPEFFYDDGLHLRPEGAEAYSRFVAQAVAQVTP